MGCNEKKDKKDLIRIVKNKNNEIFIDLTGKANGRAAYIKKDIETMVQIHQSRSCDCDNKSNNNNLSMSNKTISASAGLINLYV